jgi:hypothetical protein
MEVDDMGIIRKRTQGRRLRALTTALALAVLAALLLAGAAQAAKPGRPTAKTPKVGSIVTTLGPTFKWGKAARATRYEVRVYKGTVLKVKKTGLRGLSWKSGKVLTRGGTYTWKVRGRKGGVNGAWSKSLKFAVALHLIGDAYQGGKVAYVLQAGDPGYVAGQTHGLIAASADQTGVDPIRWSLVAYQSVGVPGGTSTALGTGSANTDAIIAQNGAGSAYAAGLARAYSGGGYGDWYLPSKDELNELYRNRLAIGGFPADGPWYWSSSEDSVKVNWAWLQAFDAGEQINNNKANLVLVRAVRAF